MLKTADAIGMKFGRLTIVEYSHTTKVGMRVFWCLCSCGNKRQVYLANLKFKRTFSCGCFNDEMRTLSSVTHGLSGSKEYNSWLAMRSRCADKKNKAYGGKGIIICKRWDSFTNFLNDMSHAPTEKHSIDRIDSNKNYTPENCRWATAKEQANNTTKNRHIIINGEKMTCSQGSEKFKINLKTLYRRLSHGWTAPEAVGIEPHKKRVMT